MSSICQVHFRYLCPALTGNDVKLFESKQLDERNNNVTDDEDNVVVLPSAPHSQSSSSTSSPPSSLRSSPSSSPLSPSSASSSDAVSTCGYTEIIRPMTVLDNNLYCCFPLSQDSDGTPCKTAKQQSGRSSSTHREKAAVVSNHRTQSHTTSTLSANNKGGKVCFASPSCNPHRARSLTYLDFYIIFSSSCKLSGGLPKFCCILALDF